MNLIWKFIHGDTWQLVEAEPVDRDGQKVNLIHASVHRQPDGKWEAYYRLKHLGASFATEAEAREAVMNYVRMDGES